VPTNRQRGASSHTETRTDRARAKWKRTIRGRRRYRQRPARCAPFVADRPLWDVKAPPRATELPGVPPEVAGEPEGAGVDDAAAGVGSVTAGVGEDGSFGVGTVGVGRVGVGTVGVGTVGTGTVGTGTVGTGTVGTGTVGTGTGRVTVGPAFRGTFTAAATGTTIPATRAAAAAGTPLTLEQRPRSMRGYGLLSNG
jgi:hypothetical protein